MAVIQMNPKAVNLVATWVEALIYGIYTSLFFESMFIIAKRSNSRKVAPRIFTGIMILMYVVAGLHLSFGFYRVIRGYAELAGTPAGDTYFSGSTITPEKTAFLAMHTAMIIMGQLLLIYRCYVIWGGNKLIIIPSVLLFLTSLSVSLGTSYFWSRQGALRDTHYRTLVTLLYPIPLAQNVWTTGLIIFRLVWQDRKTKATGLSSVSSRLGFSQVGFIILESTAIYTMVLFINFILYLINHNATQIVVSASIPTLGIVWNLVNVRLYRNSEDTRKPTLVTVTNEWALATHIEPSRMHASHRDSSPRTPSAIRTGTEATDFELPVKSAFSRADDGSDTDLPTPTHSKSS